MQRAERAIALAWVALGCFVLSGCSALDLIWGKKVKAIYCNDHPSDSDCKSAFPDGGDDKCMSNASCMAPTSVCDVTGSMMCVECIAPMDTSACAGTTPVCAADHTCKPCGKHSDCPLSNACLPDGSCALATDVAYVQGGASGTMCTLMAPCGTLDAGIKANRSYVKIASGTVSDANGTIIDGKAVTILSEAGAQLTRTVPGVILTVQNDGADVRIYDLEITNGTGVNNPAISIPSGGAPKLTLARVAIDGNQGLGISSSAALLTISQSTISSNQGGGIQMNADAVVRVTNNFIHHNGNDVTASFGALLLRPMTGSRVDFNTIVDNKANLGTASAGGIFCDVPGFVADNNIIFRNTGGQTTMQQTFGSCSYGRSFVVAAPAADNTPQFAHPNTLPFDYHLTSQTPTTIRDAAGMCSDIDFDGDERPIGPACDLGADEYRPGV